MTVSLLPDARRRAMLEEMGVRVWLPEERESARPADAGAAQRSPAPSRASHGIDLAAAPASLISRVPGPGVAAAAAAATATCVAPPVESPRIIAPPDNDRAAAIARMDWSELQAAVGGCRACALCESRKNTVFGVGQSQAPIDWLIVGEAPGENEDIQGEPFVGAAGKLLDNMLKAVGLDRAGAGATHGKVFIVNVLKCRPPGNRNPQAVEIAQCLPHLARQIELLKPRLILALGRFAVQALLQPSVPDVERQPLGRLRGRVYRFHEVPVVVSYHPAYLLRSLPDKAKGWADLVLARQVLNDERAPKGAQ